MIRTVPHWLASLFALLSLTACGLLPKRPTVVSRPVVIEVPLPAYQPIPSQLTQPIAEPPAPPLLCILNGAAVPCVLDALATIPAYRHALDVCNADRRRVGLLSATSTWGFQ